MSTQMNHNRPRFRAGEPTLISEMTAGQLRRRALKGGPDEADRWLKANDPSHRAKPKPVGYTDEYDSQHPTENHGFGLR